MDFLKAINMSEVARISGVDYQRIKGWQLRGTPLTKSESRRVFGAIKKIQATLEKVVILDFVK